MQNYSNYVDFTDIMKGSFKKYENLQKLLEPPFRDYLYVIMSYNICWNSVKNKTRHANIIKNINEISPDICGLQEASIDFESNFENYRCIGSNNTINKNDVQTIIMYNADKFKYEGECYIGQFEPRRQIVIAKLTNIKYKEEILFISVHFDKENSTFADFNKQTTEHIKQSKLLTSEIDRIMVVGDFNLNAAETESDYPITIHDFIMQIDEKGKQLNTSDYIFDSYGHFYYYDPSSYYYPVVAVSPVVIKNYENPDPIEQTLQKNNNNSCFAHSALQLLKLITNKVDNIKHDEQLMQQCGLIFGNQEDAGEFITKFIASSDIELTTIFLSALKFQPIYTNTNTNSIKIGPLEYSINLPHKTSVKESILSISAGGTTIKYTSNYLMMTIKRYKHSNGITKKITEHMTIDDMIIVDGKKYARIGIIIHNGGVNAGHYFTYLTTKKNEWYEANDMAVDNSNREIVDYKQIQLTDKTVIENINKNASVLLYKYDGLATQQEMNAYHNEPIKSDEKVIIIESTFDPSDKSTQIDKQEFYNKIRSMVPNINIKEFYLTNQMNDILFPNDVYPASAIKELKLNSIEIKDFIYQPEAHIKEAQHILELEPFIMKNFDSTYKGHAISPGLFVFDVLYVSNVNSFDNVKGVYHIVGLSDKINQNMTIQPSQIGDPINQIHLKFVEAQYIAILNNVTGFKNKSDDIAIYIYAVPDITHAKKNTCQFIKSVIQKWKKAYEIQCIENNRKIVVVVDCGKTQDTLVDMKTMQKISNAPVSVLNYSTMDVANDTIILLKTNAADDIDIKLTTENLGKCKSSTATMFENLSKTEQQILYKLCDKHPTINLSKVTNKLTTLLQIPNIYDMDLDDVLEKIYTL